MRRNRVLWIAAIVFFVPVWLAEGPACKAVQVDPHVCCPGLALDRLKEKGSSLSKTGGQVGDPGQEIECPPARTECDTKNVGCSREEPGCGSTQPAGQGESPACCPDDPGRQETGHGTKNREACH
jgi:hypothetical protein